MVAFKEWLERNSLGRYHAVLASNSIDLEIVTELGEADLVELGLTLGDRKRMLLAIMVLREARSSPVSQTADAATVPVAKEMNDGLQERRHLTLMFVDLVGSTKMSTELDLEAYRDALHQYQNCCLAAIREHHGHVAQFIGDGVTAYFGYPSAEEDDAERAVLAGLDICRLIGDVMSLADRALQVRVGISTGEVIVDEQMMREGLALGDAANLAARIQAAADPGTVAISDPTKQLLGRNFDCIWQGEHTFKGFGTPTGVWLVRDVLETELRFEARQKGDVSPIVDREDEIKLLESRWTAACRGDSQVAMLSGEAGIGKSRLVEALTERVRQDQGLRLSFQCMSNHDGNAFFPIISFVNYAARIARSDSPERKLEKLKNFLLRWFDEVDEPLSAIANLLSIPVGPWAPDPGLSPEEIKERLQDVLIGFVTRVAVRKPALLVFEDLHWIDPSTEEFIDLLIERLETERAMILCTHRPDYANRWTGLARVASLPIARLDKHHSHAMVRNVLADERVPDEVEEQIVLKTDGVPLFVEEMARMVRQRYVQRDDEHADDDVLALPSTLKDLLRAKIDSLASARDIVPVCAAIGRNIVPSMVQAVSGQSFAAVRALLDQLVEAQILVPRGNQPDRLYWFRHALIQDAAYELMLPSRARALHRRIAEVMVTSFPDWAASSPDLLAQQYAKAHMHGPARDAWRDAAHVATRRSANEETIQHLGAALSENDKVDDGAERDREEITLRRMLNVALHKHAFGSVEVRDNINRLHELLQKTNAEASDTFLSLHVRFGGHLMLGDPESALALCPKIEAAAEDAGNPTMAALNAHNWGMGKFMNGAFDAAITHFDRAQDLRKQTSAQEVFQFHAADIGVVDTAMRCWAMVLKDADGATLREELASGVIAAETEDHDFSRCYALNILATAHQPLGDTGTVKRLVAAALQISRQRRFRYWDAWSAIIRGWARARSGDPSGGIAELRRGIDDYLATGSTQILLYAQTLLADIHLAHGDITRGLAAIDEVRAGQKTNLVRYQNAMTDRIEAALLKARSGAS